MVDMDPHLALTSQPNKYPVLLLQVYSLFFFSYWSKNVLGPGLT